MVYIITIVIGIFAICTSLYAYNVKRQGINKLMDNIIKYDKKKKAEQQKSKV